MARTDRPAARRDALRKRMRAEAVDALIVSTEANVRYLTGFTGDSSVLVLTTKRALLVSDGRYTTQLEQECPGIEAVIRPVTQMLIPGVAEAVAGLGVSRVGFERTSMTVADFETLREGLGKGPTELGGVDGWVERLRMVKDREEIAVIREAVSQAERGFTRFVAGLRLEDREVDAADDLESAMRRCGAAGPSFPPIIAVGPHSALPHARPRADARLGDAPFVLVDWGASTRGQGYKSDLTRMVATGKVSDKFARVYRTVLAAQERAIAAVRPGALASDVDAAARSTIEEAGFGRAFVHGTGHGIGLDIHEAPRLRRGSDQVLEPGMVVTIEPGIYLPGWGGIRIEDDVLVTEEGSEILTSVPKTLDDVAWPGAGRD